jgi:hypothetical protein
VVEVVVDTGTAVDAVELELELRETVAVEDAVGDALGGRPNTVSLRPAARSPSASRPLAAAIAAIEVPARVAIDVSVSPGRTR